MKIGILTLPLHTNYGGVLQAYALQYSLCSMGHDAYLIDCRCNPQYQNIIKRPAAAVLGFASKCIPSIAKHIGPIEHQMRADKVVMRQNTEKFITDNIRLKHYFNYYTISKDDFDAIVVGSDQVWRPQYFKPIEAAYLDFAHKWSIKRVAYGASFGVDNWEYNNSQGETCRHLVSLFNALSLRETSGVELCRSYLSRDAELVADPTLLLCKEDYILLTEKVETLASGGNMMVSFLDENPDKLAFADKLAGNFSAKTFSVNSRVEDRTAPLNERVQPPVEQWIRGFIDADYIVTDSYHSMLFAIIFNKPFVVYGNQERGNSRFTSILKILNLETQLATFPNSFDLQNCFAIDWDNVNYKLQELKAKSLNFLRASLK